MDVTNLYTNTPQEEGINIVCTAYETFYNETPSIPKRLLAKALRLILQENSFQFNKRNYIKNGRSLCQSFHGGNRKTNPKRKRSQTTGLEALY